MPHVHFFLNPKGGTGKSLFSYVFAQYLMSKNNKTQCIDCDPVTPTLNKYKALDVLYMDIMEGNDIQKTKFDNFAQIFMQSQEDCHFVVDNGTSSYVALSEYLISNDFISVLKELGFDVSFHVIIVGGDNMEETIRGMNDIIIRFGDRAHIILWLNPFFGKIEKDGMLFELSPMFERCKERLYGILRFPDFPKDTFGISFAKIQKDRLCFHQVCDVNPAPNGYDIMTVHRVKLIRKQLFEMLDAVRIV